MIDRERKIVTLIATPILLSGFLSGFYIDYLKINPTIFWIHDIFIWLVLPASCLLLIYKKTQLRAPMLGLSLASIEQFDTQTLWRVVVTVLLFLSFIPIQNFLGFFLPPSTAAFTYNEIFPSGLGKLPTFYFAVTAALVEELFYRGLLKWIIVDGNDKFATRAYYVLISATLFGLNHWSQSLFKVIATTYLGVIAAILYLRFRSLWYVLLGHFLVNMLL